jgi:hypothetical protein
MKLSTYARQYKQPRRPHDTPSRSYGAANMPASSTTRLVTHPTKEFTYAETGMTIGIVNPLFFCSVRL